MNFYIDTPLSHVMPGLVAGALTKGQESRSEAYVENIDDMIRDAVQHATADVDAQQDILVSLRKREIVRLLYERGVFNIKDAVTLVAKEMGISINTVYLHLRNIKPGDCAVKTQRRRRVKEEGRK